MLLTHKQTTPLLLAKLFAGIFVLLCSVQVIAQISSSSSSNVATNSVEIIPNSSVTLDFSVTTAESWDAQDDTSNVVEHCISGTTITGFEYSNITMQTIPGSFFSEVSFYFSDSNQGEDTGIKFKMGSGNDTSGTAVFNSNGIFDITDSGIPSDINSLADGQFILQIFEDIDDIPNSIDAEVTSGTMTIWGLDLVAVEGCPFIDNSMPATADLSLSYTSQETGLNVGDTVDISLVITNEGEAEAVNVVMGNELSDNLDLIDLSCDDGSNTANRSSLSSFSVQNIASQSHLDCLLRTEINNTGNFGINISVSADSEINPNNNSVNIFYGPAGVIVPVNNWLALLILGLLVIVSIRKHFKQSY